MSTTTDGDGRAAAHPAPDALPRASVVVVNYNGRRHLERCLPALAAHTAADVEVIVVDNGSTDGSLEWLAAAHPGVRVLPMGRNAGFGAANARGIEAAGSGTVVLLNNDTVVRPGWLEPLLDALAADPDIAAACSVLHLMDRPGLLNAVGGGVTRLGFGFDAGYGFPVSLAADGPAVADTAFPTAAAMAMRRDDFLAAGGFDPAFFMYHEDVDLGWRWWLLGRRVVVCRGSVVEHACGGTVAAGAGLRWRERLGARHALRTLLKHLEPGALLATLPRLAALWVRQRAFGRMAHVVLWNLAHLPGTLVERRRIQRRRRRTGAELLCRGLVDAAPFPAPAPDLPRPAPADLVEAPSLRPGVSSALGRLGPGWYAPEEEDGEALRWTCGEARCVLRVAAGAEGELQVTLRTPAAPGACEVTLVCNGVESRHPVPAGAWRTVAVPVRSGPAGEIEVTLRAPAAGRRHENRHDYRRVGCAVRLVRWAAAARPSAPRISTVTVVIPTYNRAPVLLRTLEALTAQSWPDLEAVVVDDGSTDGTWERLEAWREAHRDALALTTLRQANTGPGQARNRGVAAARGDLVVFLGDDTIPAPDLVAAHVEAHRALAEPAAVVGFTDWDRDGMRVTPFLEHVNAYGEQFGYALFADGGDIPFTCLYTSNVSVPRALLGSEPFRADFTRAAWEDAELGYRLNLRGVRLVYRADARTSHLHPMTMRGFLRRQRGVGAAVATVYRLHPELLGDPQMPPARPPWWMPAARLAMPAAAPLLSMVDRLGVRLPGAVYRAAALWVYFGGWRDAGAVPAGGAG